MQRTLAGKRFGARLPSSLFEALAVNPDAVDKPEAKHDRCDERPAVADEREGHAGVGVLAARPVARVLVRQEGIGVKAKQGAIWPSRFGDILETSLRPGSRDIRI